MAARTLQWIVLYCMVICVVHLSLVVAQQRDEDTHTIESQGCGNGIPGIPGVPGNNGLQGPVGPKGDSGSHGLNGIPGQKGDRGQGSKGQPGQKGTTGKAGPKGNKGEVGFTGIGGAKGDKGSIGGQGPQGPKGSIGGQGPQGPKGSIGGQGPQGPKGSTGRQGLKGHKGYKGEVGQVQQQPRVAFSVAKTTSMGPVSGHQVVVYDKVYTNDGNGYNTTSGKFRAPVAGKYYFMISGMRDTSNHLFLCMMKNTSLLPCVFVNNSGGRLYGAASNSVIVDLQQGDEVWVRLYNGRAVFSNSNEYTTFTGYLLYSNTQ